jgi:dTDP-4-dehydrorhamnose 3,5-epimerase
MKIVSCIRGAIFDVAVDIRAGSKTFLHWFGTRLDEESGMGLIIPEGFAHGFQALSTDTEILYCTSAPYDRSSEGGLNALDPALSITWPLPIAQRSPKDEQLPLLSGTFMGVQI